MVILLSSAGVFTGCKKGNTFPGGVVSSVIAITDVRNIYKGSDITLDTKNMFGAHYISGIVISDFTGGNMLPGLLMVQDRRRLSQLRGIAIPLGNDAAKYVSGDSVTIDVAGGVLTKINGMLQLTNIPGNAVSKISSGNKLSYNQVPTTTVLKNPSVYECSLVAIVKGGFDPIPAPTDTYAGDKTLNDGFGNITLHTEATANFANNNLQLNANYFGVCINLPSPAKKDSLITQIRMRKGDDIQVLSPTKLARAVISGFINDVSGTDANYEYIQLLATQDIDFSKTPFSLVTCNNAGATTPIGFPANGWATGDLKTYKFNLTSGTVSKGQFFYVGGSTKTINGSSSTSMASSKWIRGFNYSTTDGDGIGTKTTNLLANSGNAFGMALFEGTTVTADTQPIDAVFVSTGGSLFTAGPPIAGYRIANNDFYDAINPITLVPQPYNRQGSNTMAFTYTTPADQGFYYKLGGVYDARLGRWTLARTQSIIQLTKTSALTEIEGEFPVGTPDKPGTLPTTLKN